MLKKRWVIYIIGGQTIFKMRPGTFILNSGYTDVSNMQAYIFSIFRVESASKKIYFRRILSLHHIYFNLSANK